MHTVYTAEFNILKVTFDSFHLSFKVKIVHITAEKVFSLSLSGSTAHSLTGGVQTFDEWPSLFCPSHRRPFPSWPWPSTAISTHWTRGCRRRNTLATMLRRTSNWRSSEGKTCWRCVHLELMDTCLSSWGCYRGGCSNVSLLGRCWNITTRVSGVWRQQQIF